MVLDAYIEKQLEKTEVNGITYADYIRENYKLKMSSCWVHVYSRIVECNACKNRVSLENARQFFYCPYCGVEMKGFKGNI